jgi:hypothetical protein
VTGYSRYVHFSIIMTDIRHWINKRQWATRYWIHRVYLWLNARMYSNDIHSLFFLNSTSCYFYVNSIPHAILSSFSLPFLYRYVEGFLKNIFSAFLCKISMLEIDCGWMARWLSGNWDWATGWGVMVIDSNLTYFWISGHPVNATKCALHPKAPKLAICYSSSYSHLPLYANFHTSSLNTLMWCFITFPSINEIKFRIVHTHI